MNVATTILQQLGGHKFAAMTGAKSFRSDGNSLVFRLPKTPGFVKQSINFVKITLMPDDTYKMEFYRIHIRKHIPILDQIKEYTDVYWEQLQELFTETTGLDTHL